MEIIYELKFRFNYLLLVHLFNKINLNETAMRWMDCPTSTVSIFYSTQILNMDRLTKRTTKAVFLSRQMLYHCLATGYGVE